MLKADGITAAENAFMQGREMHPKKRKTSSHKDTVSVDLAAEEYTEDSISVRCQRLFLRLMTVDAENEICHYPLDNHRVTS